jgi:adenylate cyclase
MGWVQSERLQAVWNELRRRKVFQVALVYVLMAWGVMQVGELLFEALQVPEGAYSLLVILVLLGFPMAVVLAWAYEITPDGVRRDRVQELREDVRYPTTGHRPLQRKHRNHRLAVLPFRDITPHHDIDYFCDGIAEEIQNALCNTDGLEVVACAHAARFSGRKVDIERVRQNLRVDAVIEGSVRRFDGRYRISVQLVDAHSGTDVWSRSFELNGEREFEAQKVVAAEVARYSRESFWPTEGDEPQAQAQLSLGYPMLDPFPPATGKPQPRH